MQRLMFEVLRGYAEHQSLDLVTDLYGFTSNDIQDAQEALEKIGYLSSGSVTQKGILALEPYRVKRAIFLAAGFGSRMTPITINTPKPLVRVHGKRIIETMIEAVLAAGIDEIYIVYGYLGEQFELLKKKYPMIHLIENKEYEGTGTISSFYYAKDYLSCAYVLESDLVVAEPSIIKKYHYSSDFLGTKVGETDDWYFRVTNGLISEIGVGGKGDDCYRLIGVSFWSETDGRRLKNDINQAYWSNGGKKLPMSYVPFRVYRDQYQVSIMPCRQKDVIEIDSFAELQAFDEKYRV